MLSQFTFYFHQSFIDLCVLWLMLKILVCCFLDCTQSFMIPTKILGGWVDIELTSF